MASTGAHSTGQHPQPHSPPAWLNRLWEQERVPLPTEKLRWWSVHVQGFIAAVRRHQWQGAVEVLVEKFLQAQEQTTPPVPDWRQRQARQAPEVFGELHRCLA